MGLAKPSDGLTERQAFLVLNSLPGMGSVALNRLLAGCGGDPRAVLGSAAAGASIANWPAHFDLAREEKIMARSGVDFITPRDSAYPKLLREIHDPPVCLYRKGRYGFEHPCLGIIGSRRTTLYGQRVARQLGADLVRRGFCVVSGLARGIDTAAHEGALEAGGRTVAVLGTGIDTVYPPENLGLFRRVAESGAILSEFRFGSRASHFSFPMRNRIVSGMCAAVVVVESDVDGGAMITARFAGEQGRTVFAVPGRIDQATSAGCHQLIRDGATLLTSVEDIFSDLSYLDGFQPAQARKKGRSPSGSAGAPGLTEEEQTVLSGFSGGEILTPDALAARSGLASEKLSAALTMLELKQLVAKRLDGAYEAV